MQHIHDVDLLFHNGFTMGHVFVATNHFFYFLFFFSTTFSKIFVIILRFFYMLRIWQYLGTVIDTPFMCDWSVKKEPGKDKVVSIEWESASLKGFCYVMQVNKW